MVEKAALIKLSPALDWVIYTRIGGYDYVEASPGVSVPMRLEHESLSVKKQEAEKGILPKAHWRWNIQVHQGKVNEPLADSVFEITFPPGLFVNDATQGRSCQVTEEVPMSAPEGTPHCRWWRVVAGAAVILALLAALMIARLPEQGLTRYTGRGIAGRS